MKTIHLLRHAKSSWSESELADHDRPLDPRGEKEARALAKALRAERWSVDLVLCSTALRARQTLDPLIPVLGEQVPIRFETQLFHASAATLLRRLRALPAHVERVLVVGHSPGLDELIGTLAGHGDLALREALAAKLPTCTLVTLRADVPRFASLEPRSAELVAAQRGKRGKRSRAFAKPKTRVATKAKALELDRDARWAEAARAALDACRAHLEANLAGAEDADVESVHQLRVALRRTRVVLTLFRQLLDAQTLDALRTELRWLAGELGALREAQVFAEELLTPLRAKSPRASTLTALAQAVDDEIVRRAHAARAALRGPRGRTALERLRELRFQEGGVGRDRARKRAEKRLERRLEAVLVRAEAAHEREPAAMHELRKELKKLRYASEVVASLFDVDAVRPYVSTLSHLQDVIGALQDEAVSREMVGALLRTHGQEARIARAMALVDRHYRAEQPRDGEMLTRALDRFASSEPFWR